MVKQKIIEKLIPIVCNKGYSEMSISCISEATGLKKSSIYHFFANGKSQIALEIIQFVQNLLSESFTEIMNSGDLPFRTLHKALDVLSEFYGAGKRNCLIDVMTIGNTDHKMQEASGGLAYKLIDIFKTILISADLDAKNAEKKSIEIVTLLQGSLVLSRATHNNQFFVNCIRSLKREYPVIP